MTHIWLRNETRADEKRCALTPEGAAALQKFGFRISIEEMPTRVFSSESYSNSGCAIVPANSWVSAPKDAFILGLKELPDDDIALNHRHIMFGHAYKGQHAGQRLLKRFNQGGGTLYDLEYLTDETGHRVAAFGYWAGYAGAAVTIKAWVAQEQGQICPPVSVYDNKETMLNDVKNTLHHLEPKLPNALVLGALGRVGRGVVDLCTACGIQTTHWDMEETVAGGPFPEILNHDLFFNCVLAGRDTPPFLPSNAGDVKRQLRTIGDIACDPDSDYNPVPLYTSATSWSCPITRVHENPPLDVMAIDNLPSLLPRESSIDFADQILAQLQTLDSVDKGVWSRAKTQFKQQIKLLEDVNI